MNQVIMDGLTAAAGLQLCAVFDSMAMADAACLLKPGFGCRIHRCEAAVEADSEELSPILCHFRHPPRLFQVIRKRLIYIYC
ncbi:hypothetical protein D3C74_457970 [compost metagenome]